jgi:FKBP-type peptidyl-prolyl cis-trans isomerase 2
MKDAFREFDKTKLPKDVEPQIGMMLELKDQDGNAFPAVISEVKDKSVMLDFNHPLAGKELQFDVKIVSIE